MGTSNNNDFPTTSYLLPPQTFTGGLRKRPLGLGVSAPLGKLEVGGHYLVFSGLGEDYRVTKEDVAYVVLRRGLLSSRVFVVFLDGSKSQVYFASLGRSDIRRALQLREWPVKG